MSFISVSEFLFLVLVPHFDSFMAFHSSTYISLLLCCLPTFPPRTLSISLVILNSPHHNFNINTIPPSGSGDGFFSPNWLAHLVILF